MINFMWKLQSNTGRRVILAEGWHWRKGGISGRAAPVAE